MKALYIFISANSGATFQLNVLPWMERNIMAFSEFAVYSVWLDMLRENLTMLCSWQNALYVDMWKHWVKFFLTYVSVTVAS